ncbi:hypothetical protein AX15_000790 [Amanita polypyramis BW_CC]|nr:hypothetical protein AX15_000790 [Amanita polypyramis BW_CC]
MLCLLLVAQLFWDCEPRRRWKLLNPPQCHIGLQVAIFQLISDILVDLTLLIAPLCLFRSIRDEWLRYRLVGIFSTCIITTVVSLVHAAYILTKGGVRVLIAGLVEASSSLFGNMVGTDIEIELRFANCVQYTRCRVCRYTPRRELCGAQGSTAFGERYIFFVSHVPARHRL